MKYFHPKKREPQSPPPKRFFSKSSIQRKGESNDLPFFQPKLTIGQPGDKYEQEADAMADKVVSNQGRSGPQVQQKCATCENEGPVLPKLQRQEEEEEAQAKFIQRMGEEEEEAQAKFEVQRQGEEEEEAQAKFEVQRMEEEEEAQAKHMPGILRKADGSMQTSRTFSNQLNTSKGGGQPMSNSTQENMNRSFGVDFSNVRVHTGANSVQMNRDIKAQAFTHGKDIYFNQGKYQPESHEGKKLLAHELTHTIQQGAVKSK